ncbi:MAG: hypothetical protein H0U74_09995 [Bradymonadaceae bacterium]|nr:hypothetical protein [Lujinxingiaceae bacterium]
MNKSPKSSPCALVRAQRIGREAGALGFDWPTVVGALEKVDEEVGELRALLDRAESADERVAEELGDLLFAVVNVARKLDIDAEQALQSASVKFERRFAYVLNGLLASGRSPQSASLDEMEALWQQAKAIE